MSAVLDLGQAWPAGAGERPRDADLRDADLREAELRERLCRPDAVGLAELDAQAALQTRTDRKYVVPAAVAAALVGELAGRARVLEIDGERAFRYESVYFDTPDLALFADAARGRPRRAKVRTRLYVDSGLCMLEVKTRDARGRTVKHRRPHPASDRGGLTPDALAFVAGFDGVAELREHLAPALTTRFSRATLLLVDGRATLDAGLRMAGPRGQETGLVGDVLVETKSAGRPTAVDRLLWAAHHRPVRVSKYGAGLASLRPDLPANRWHRVVREHLAASW